MRVSQLFGITLRQEAISTGIDGHDLLIRAGYFRLPSAGKWQTLALGRRLLHQLNSFAKTELARLGATEFSISESPSETSLTLPTTLLACINQEVNSYRQLPLMIWQQKEANFFSSRTGPGLYGAEHPLLIETWVLSKSESELIQSLNHLQDSIIATLDRLGLPRHEVLTDSRWLGNQQAKSFVYPQSEGDIAYYQQEGEWISEQMANTPISQVSERVKSLEEVHTPDTKTIKDLAAYLGIDASQTAKVVFYTAETIHHADPIVVMLIVRGDHEVNESSVRRQIDSLSIRPSTEEEIVGIGAVPGFASPIGIKRKGVMILVDEAVTQEKNLVTGANKLDYHFLYSCYGRDYEADHIGIFRQAQGITYQQGVELAKVVHLGTVATAYTETTFMNEQGKPVPLYLGYAHWNFSNIVAALAERYADPTGIAWPPEISPFQVMLISLADGEETVQTANAIYEQMVGAGISVLYDDRHKKVAGPGVKFTDADLRGIPLRITVAKRALKQGGVEWKFRSKEEKEIVAIPDVLPRISEYLS